MSGTSRRTAAVVATALLASPVLAQAQPPSAADRAAAGELVKKAIASSHAGDHDAAIAIYWKAYKLVPNSALLSNIGSEYQQRGKPREALRYFCMYLDNDPSGTNAPYARTQARLLQIQLGNKEVDDADLCTPPSAPNPPRPERAEPDEVGPPARRVAAEPRRDPAPRAPEPARRTSPTLTYAGLAVGAAGLVAAGVGLYEGVKAQDITDQINSHPIGEPWPVNIRALEENGQAHESRQIGFLVAGGVLVTAGVVVFALGRMTGSPEPARDATSVRVTPTHNGVAVFGSF